MDSFSRYSLIFLLFASQWIPVTVKGQQSHLMNQKVFNLEELNYGVAVAVDKTNYLLAGDILTDGSYTDFLVSKLVNDTTLVRQNNYGGSLSETFNAILPLGDTAWILAGSAASDDGDLTANYGVGDCWLLCIDTAGTMLWQRNYGGSAYDRADDIKPFKDGYLVVGSTRSNDVDVTVNHGGSDIWLFMIDRVGTLLWQKSFGGSDSDNGEALEIVNDSVVMIFGSTKSMDGDVHLNHGKSDYWLIKYSVSGDSIVWEKTYGGEESDATADMVRTADGGFVMAGNSRTGESGSRNNGANDYRIIEVDSSGVVIWDHSFGGSMDEIAADILKADGEGFLVSGYTYSNDGDVEGSHGGRDMWIVKLNDGGRLIWQRALGGMYNEVASGADVCSDGGYRIVGSASSKDGDVEGHQERKMDTWTVKLCEDHYIKEFVNICAGQQYEWEGALIGDPGIYIKQFVNRCGFDSTRQLKLVVNDYPDNFEITGNAEPYFGREATYSAPLIYNNIYHWFVENGVVVDTPAFNQVKVIWGIGDSGMLSAVAESSGGCQSDTAYFEVTIVGESLDETDKVPLVVYPNPTSGVLFIEGEGVENSEAYTIEGVLINAEKNRPASKKIKIDLTGYPAGVYYLRVRYKNRIVVKRIVKM